MKKIILMSVLVIAIITTVSAQNSALKTEVIKVEYTCPMHPEVISDKPGECPKCGMDLVKKEAQSTKVIYTCPMHKEVISDISGKCPKCGMKLQKKEVAVTDSTKTKKACCGMLKM